MTRKRPKQYRTTRIYRDVDVGRGSEKDLTVARILRSTGAGRPEYFLLLGMKEAVYRDPSDTTIRGWAFRHRGIAELNAIPLRALDLVALHEAASAAVADMMSEEEAWEIANLGEGVSASVDQLRQLGSGYGTPDPAEEALRHEWERDIPVPKLQGDW